jgi:SM-20-related protein
VPLKTFLPAASTFPLPAFSETLWQTAATALTTSGHVVIENALPLECWLPLRGEAEALLGDHAFAAGRIGRDGDTHREGLVRGDSLCWLEQEMAAGGPYLRWMDELRVALNRALFLGMNRFDAHYSHFAVGSAYGTHLDRYGNSNARLLSAVFYCNQDWPTDAGGEFVLYDDDGLASASVAPRGGTLVLFLSAGARHEAKVALRPRWSIAGWFHADG